jgi:hypothetical protein
MTAEKQIRDDPHADADARKLHEWLKPLKRALQQVARQHPEIVSMMHAYVDPLLDTNHTKCTAAFHDRLFDLGQRYGVKGCERGLIAAQIQFPDLRKLYERRQLARELACLFRGLL